MLASIGGEIGSMRCIFKLLIIPNPEHEDDVRKAAVALTNGDSNLVPGPGC